MCGMKLGLVFAAVALLAASSAAAGEFIENVQFGNFAAELVIEVGNQPVTVNQSNQFNFVDVFQANPGGAATTTIGQTGTVNLAAISQTGASTSAAISQFGAMNGANVNQLGNTNNSLLTQVGNLNTGTVAQFGQFSLSVMSQSVH